MNKEKIKATTKINNKDFGFVVMNLDKDLQIEIIKNLYINLTDILKWNWNIIRNKYFNGMK